MHTHWTELTNNQCTLEVIICVSILASVFQFSRIYHYIHLFDRCHHDDEHFICSISGWPRRFDRVLRWAAGIFVIISIEIWGERKLHESAPNFTQQSVHDYKSLSPFAILLFATFTALLLWDGNLYLWKKRSDSSATGKIWNWLQTNIPKIFGRLPILGVNAGKSLKEYDPNLKALQRSSGMIFSACLYFLLMNPNSILAVFGFGMAFLAFVGLWIWDYNFFQNPGRNWTKPLIETFSPVLTILDLFPESNCRPAVAPVVPTTSQSNPPQPR